MPLADQFLEAATGARTAAALDELALARNATQSGTHWMVTPMKSLLPGYTCKTLFSWFRSRRE